MIPSPFHLSRKLCLLRCHPYLKNATNISKRKLSNIKVHPLFNQWQLAPNVWRLEEKYFDSWNLANIYFVKGTDADLLVDTGIGVHYLPSYLLWSKVIKILDRLSYGWALSKIFDTLESKLWNQVPSSSLSRWMILTLEKNKTSWMLWCWKVQN